MIKTHYVSALIHADLFITALIMMRVFSAENIHSIMYHTRKFYAEIYRLLVEKHAIKKRLRDFMRSRDYYPPALSEVGDVLVLPVTHARNSLRLPSLLYVHIPLQRIDMTRILLGMLVSHSTIYFTLSLSFTCIVNAHIREKERERATIICVINSVS